MSETQFSFARKEIKYVLPQGQYDALMEDLVQHFKLDEFGRHTINNIYYDTPDFSMIKHSLDRPVYKEKFRVRAYGDAPVKPRAFAEIKKKYRGTVYKRRIAAGMKDVFDFVENAADMTGSVDEFERSYDNPILANTDTQIRREIEELLRMYRPIPQIYLAYERRAYYGIEDKSLRVTFDENIRARRENLDFCHGSEGDRVTDDIIMEIKISDACPLWFCDILSKHGLKKASFSKIGTYYTNLWESHLLC